MMSRKLERVNIITSILKVHLKYQKYLKENLKSHFFSASEGAGTKRMLFLFKLQVHGYLEGWLLVSIRVYKLKKSIF